MNLSRENRIRRRRRLLLWVLGATVVLLLAIIVSQQLWLWTVVRPDTPADALMLYALSTLNCASGVPDSSGTAASKATALTVNTVPAGASDGIVRMRSNGAW